MRPLTLFLITFAAANAQHKIEFSAYNAKACIATVTFDGSLSAVPDATVHDTNGKTISHPAPTFAPGSTKTVEFAFSSPCPKSVKDIQFQPISFVGAQTPQSDLTATIDSTTGLITLMSKVAQTQAEKSIFASGLVTTASTGTAGAGDINLNSPNILGSKSGDGLLTGFLQVKRSTTAAADPKNFEAGIGYQAGFALGDKTPPTITALLIDFAAKTEGTASQFGVNNLVGDTSVSLQSAVIDLGPKSSFKFRLVGGMEGGSNQSKGNAPVGTGFTPLQNVDWLARGKVGFESALAYTRDEHSRLPFQSVNLNVGVVERYLFFNELEFNQTTNTTSNIAHGSRPWAQVDLKLILGQSDSAGWGVKMTYQRGSLPPVFADVKTFQFGFLYETKDRTAKK